MVVCVLRVVRVVRVVYFGLEIPRRSGLYGCLWLTFGSRCALVLKVVWLLGCLSLGITVCCGSKVQRL